LRATLITAGEFAPTRLRLVLVRHVRFIRCDRVSIANSSGRCGDMSHLHMILAIVSALAWIGIFVFHFREELMGWMVNRFGRPKVRELTPEEEEELKQPIFQRNVES